MLIDFTSMDFQAMAGFKGGEGHLDAKMFFDGQNRILRASLPLGSTVGQHVHDANSEIIFVLAGEADHVVDGVCEHLAAGQCGYCPKGSTHELITTSEEPLEFFAVVPQQ